MCSHRAERLLLVPRTQCFVYDDGEKMTAVIRSDEASRRRHQLSPGAFYSSRAKGTTLVSSLQSLRGTRGYEHETNIADADT